MIRKQQGIGSPRGLAISKGDELSPAATFALPKSSKATQLPKGSVDLENNTDVGTAPRPQGPGSPSGAHKDPGLCPCPLSGLVVIAFVKLPIPSRTRPISANTPMVLRLKTWESRSPPNLTSDSNLSKRSSNQTVPQNNARTTGSQTPGNTRRGVEQPGSSSGS